MELKPRVRFCWYCGNKLWGNHFVEAEVDGHKRILHKRCYKDMENDYWENAYYDELGWR